MWTCVLYSVLVSSYYIYIWRTLFCGVFMMLHCIRLTIRQLQYRLFMYIYVDFKPIHHHYLVYRQAMIDILLFRTLFLLRNTIRYIISYKNGLKIADIPQLCFVSGFYFLVLTFGFFFSLFTYSSIRVITKLPSSEQSYKGKVKTHKYINRQNQYKWYSTYLYSQWRIISDKVFNFHTFSFQFLDVIF